MRPPVRNLLIGGVLPAITDYTKDQSVYEALLPILNHISGNVASDPDLTAEQSAVLRYVTRRGDHTSAVIMAEMRMRGGIDWTEASMLLYNIAATDRLGLPVADKLT